MGKKLTYDFVKKSFEDRGYVLLSTIYINNHTKLDYRCPKGHIHKINFADFARGHGCTYCAGISVGNKLRFTYNMIEESFEKDGCTLLSKNYRGAHSKLKYRCSNGHVHSIKWNDWQQGHRCATCARESNATKQRNNIVDIKNSFESEGWTLLSTEYKHAHQKLKCICSNGHTITKSWNKWCYGRRCPICARLNNFGESNPRWKGGISCEPYCQDWTKEFKEFIKERDGYKCLNPDCWKKDKVLTVHHIDYDKKNCRPDNLITVCRSCNSRANTDREWHTSWYSTILKNRYSGVNYG